MINELWDHIRKIENMIININRRKKIAKILKDDSLSESTEKELNKFLNKF